MAPRLGGEVGKRKRKAGRNGRATSGGARAADRGDAGDGGGDRASKRKTGSKRGAARDVEDAEIRSIELRLTTEAPKAGSGAANVDTGGAGAGKRERGQQKQMRNSLEGRSEAS